VHGQKRYKQIEKRSRGAGKPQNSLTVYLQIWKRKYYKNEKKTIILYETLYYRVFPEQQSYGI
jgi:hypothetical protein